MFSIFIQVIILACIKYCCCYPTINYGGNRYENTITHKMAIRDPYQAVLKRHHPLSYYSQNNPEPLYYSQESLYYRPRRISGYDLYQTMLPYYYEGYPAYGYYGYDIPTTNFQDDAFQKREMMQRENDQDIGHEIMYEDESTDNMIEQANAAFLHDLIFSQVYQDSVNRNIDSKSNTPNEYSIYNLQFDDIPYDKPKFNEDKDERDLKQLPFKKLDNLSYLQGENLGRNHHVEVNKVEENIKNIKRETQLGGVQTERKPTVKSLDITNMDNSVSPETSILEQGQKEEVLIRPATPVRKPYSNAVFGVMSKNEYVNKRTPSVYDTIKHMLNEEKHMEHSQLGIKPRKRVTNEESLTRQLAVLRSSE